MGCDRNTVNTAMTVLVIIRFIFVFCYDNLFFAYHSSLLRH